MKSPGGLLFLMVVLTGWVFGQEALRLRPRYTLRTGDVLELQDRYTPELNQTVTVLPVGYINLNLIGSVKVSDLTMEDTHDLIVQTAKTRLNDPDIYVMLSELM